MPSWVIHLPIEMVRNEKIGLSNVRQARSSAMVKAKAKATVKAMVTAKAGVKAKAKTTAKAEASNACIDKLGPVRCNSIVL